VNSDPIPHQPHGKRSGGGQLFLRGFSLLAAVFACLSLTSCKLLVLRMPGEPLPKADLHLRHQTREFTTEFSTAVQQAADTIARSTTNRPIQELTIRWKIGAIAAIRQATLRTSPQLALLDAWVLCRQMTNFLQQGAGQNIFGPAQGVALTNAIALEARIAAIARSAAAVSDRRKMESFLKEYVPANPLKDLRFERLPLTAEWEAYAGDARPTPVGTGSEALADLAERVQILSEQLPAELRWRLSLEAGLWQDTFAETRTTLREIDSAMKSIAATVAATPATLSNAVVELRSLAPAFTGLEKQWNLTLSVVDTQRVALVKDIALERVAILKAVDEQRAALTETFDRQRAAMMKEVQQTATDVTERSMQQARGILKDVLFYGVLLVAVLLGLPFFFGVIVGRVTSRYGRSTAPEPSAPNRPS
jgi:hypothetical protein